MRLIIVFILGVALGYGIFSVQHTYQLPVVETQSAIQIEVPQRATQVVQKTSEGSLLKSASNTSGVVRIELFGDGGKQKYRGQGVLIGQERTLILPMSVLQNARSGRVFDEHGNQYDIGNVISINTHTGIVALNNNFLQGKYLKVAEDHSLYLGRDFVSRSLGGKNEGSITSSPIEQESGVLVFTAHFKRSLDLTGSALLDQESNDLIGIVIGDGQNPFDYDVVDSTAILKLLNSMPVTTPISIAEFSSQYIEKTPAGVLAQVVAYVREGKWQKAIGLSEQLLEQDASYFSRLKDHLERAYYSQIKYLLESGKINEARSLLDRAVDLIGETGQRVILYSTLEHKLGNYRKARDMLRQAVVFDPELEDTVNPMIRKLVHVELNQSINSGSDLDKIQMLNNELAYDQYNPVFHYVLGKLYYRTGDYREAAESLSRAVYLDNQYEEELLPLIRAAQNKQDLPLLVEVPYRADGSSIHVEVYLNDSVEPFHFVLDTGATYTSISSDAAKQLGLSFSGNVITVSTANGQVSAPVINMQSVSLNGATVHNVQTVILSNLSGVDGLLGLNYLKHFNMEVDQVLGKISLSRK